MAVDEAMSVAKKVVAEPDIFNLVDWKSAEEVQRRKELQDQLLLFVFCPFSSSLTAMPLVRRLQKPKSALSHQKSLCAPAQPSQLSQPSRPTPTQPSPARPVCADF